jgi:hypothetical protein
MRHDLSAHAANARDADVLRLACQIGQPVALAHGKAALRFSLSARMVRDCWSPDPGRAENNIAALRDDLIIAIRKLGLLIQRYPFSHEASA